MIAEIQVLFNPSQISSGQVMAISTGRPSTASGGSDYYTHINYQDLDTPSNSVLVQDLYTRASLTRSGVVTVGSISGNNQTVTMYKAGYYIKNSAVTNFAAGDTYTHYIVGGYVIFVFP